MTEKLQSPDPAPKGCEHEKWKAMVDSVIEFISASRAMLYVLNERIKMNEMVKKEEEKRLEDQRTNLAFYEECLHLEMKPVIGTKKEMVDSGTFQTMKERGDFNANMPATGKVDQTCGSDVKDKKDGETDNISTDTVSVNKSNCSDNSEKHLESPHSTANSPTITSTETTTKKICNHTECKACKVRNISKEMQSTHIEYASKEIQYSAEEGNAKAPALIGHKDILKTNCSSQSECKLIKCKRKAALENVNKTMTEPDVKSVPPSSKVLPPTPSGGISIKCPKMASRIPRTKSYTEDKSKCTLIDRTPNEGGSVGNMQCLKRSQKEVSYRSIHQRNKSPKGDSITPL